MKKKILIYLFTFSLIFIGFYISSMYKNYNSDLNVLKRIEPTKIESNENEYVIINRFDDDKTSTYKDFSYNIKDKEENTRKENNNDNTLETSKSENNKQSENKVNVTNNQENKGSYSNDEYEILARLIESEAGDEPYSGKVAVGNVVLNRSSKDRKSINDVIFQKNQFDGVQTKYFNQEPHEESKRAAIECLNGKNVVPNDTYYFANLKLCNPDFAKKDTFVIRIGDHWFFKE